MDFFQHQDQARKASRLLLLYFALAVVAIVLSVHLAVSFLLMWVSSSTVEPFDWFRLDRFVVLAGGALLIITAGSLYKIWRLRDGGHTVARLLGGRPIDPNTTDPAERRLLNVVEEMSIAAGLPVPTIYLLDKEDGINAFAAGFTPQDAVLGVTGGTMRILNREELQGVIAHEFSHIFNGDMSLNLRLMGVLHGILVIALIGYFILRSTLRAASSRKGGGAVVVLPVLGLTLIVIGYVGVFFGRVIKSAVSRQREFLADASAVQFTRNPGGVAGALKKIGGLVQGSLVMSPHAEQASHFFFSDGKLGKVRMALAGRTHFDFLSTHPPLADRIRRIDRSWNGAYPKVEPVALSDLEPKAGPRDKRAAEIFTALPAQLTALIGTLDQAHLDHSRKLLSEIPERVRSAAHDPSGARGVVLALLTSTEPEVRQKQFQTLAGSDELLLRETEALAPLLESSPREIRLPLIDLALPALRRLSPAQYQDFMKHVDSFVRADRQIDLFEYTLTHVLDRHLKPAFSRTRPPTVEFYALPALRKECAVLLSAVAHAGHKEPEGAKRAFAQGARELNGLSLSLLPLEQAGLSGVRDSLARLEKLSPKLKKDVMRAFIAASAFDATITVGEGEVLRVIADSLGLPMPPFLPGQKIASPTAP